MKAKSAIKALVAACTTVAVALPFFGLCPGLVCRIQPAATLAFLVVLLLTPLVGRLFCECLCPLGFIQAVVNWIFHPRTKVRRVCTRLPETKAQLTVRWTVLALFAVLLATGYGAVAWLVTPYSIYGKALSLFAPGLAIFAAVVVLAAFGKGRIWCNWVCPAGTLFNLLSKKSVCSHKVGPGCANCKACFPRGRDEARPSRAGDGSSHDGRDEARPSRAGDGRDGLRPVRDSGDLTRRDEARPSQACDGSSHDGRDEARPSQAGDGSSHDGRDEARPSRAGDGRDGLRPVRNCEDLTRREAIKGGAVLAAVETAEKTTDGGFAPVSLPGVPSRPAPVLPPGAADRKAFNVKCVACGLCIANCRGGCLTAATDLKRFGQPEMDFRHGHCLLGCNYACGRACPTGAINLVEHVERKNVHMGHAIWKKDLCIRTTDGVECTACSRKCPVGAIHIVDGFPVVDKGACIGCGACEHVCPARPMPAIFVKGFEKQRVVRPFDEADLVAEMVSLVAKGEASCVVARDGVIVGREKGRGIKPALKLLADRKFKHAVVVDKVVGRAAAAIFIVGKAKRVHASIMGADAAEMLKAHGVESNAERTVPKILNRDLTDGCPMEQTVEGMADPAEMVEALKAKVM